MLKDKKGSILLKAIAFILVFILLENLIGIGLMALKKDESREINSMMWNDFYKMKKNSIDVMFMGSSYARFAFDPRIFDKELGINSFNFSTPLQSPLVGYFSLLEALKTQKPKLLVYETNWKMFGVTDNNMPAFYSYDNLKDGFLKLRLMRALFGEKELSNFFLQKISNTYRYRGNLYVIFDDISKKLKEIKNGKKEEAVKQPQSDYQYSNKGYFYSQKEVDLGKIAFDKIDQSFEWQEKQLLYFQKILDLCKANNIKVLMVTAPWPKPIIDTFKKYYQYSDYFKKLAGENNLEYIDFNKINKEKQFVTDDFFMDTGHLNYKGTQAVDVKLLPVIKGCLGQ
jgi:hypothetical protein